MKTKHFFKTIFLILILKSLVFSQNSRTDDVIQIIPQQTENGYEFVIENHGDEPYKISIDVKLKNLASDVSFPFIDVLPAKSQEKAFKLWRVDSSRRSGYSFDYKWRKVQSKTQSCVEDIFCIVTELRGDSLYFTLENKQPLPVAVKFVPNGFRNIRTNHAMPFVTTYAGQQRSKMFTAWLVDEWAGWEQGFNYQWQYGVAGAQHEDSYVYALPYQRGETFTMIQGPNGEFSHQGKNAYDWEMPVDTPVCAAREGIVLTVVDRFSAGGEIERLKKEANSIEILHPDGTIGRYSHLAKGGVRVKKGDIVRRGQQIGLSGNTGYSSGPHLHFDVIRLTNDLEFESIAVRFRTKPRTVFLQAGDRYEACE